MKRVSITTAVFLCVLASSMAQAPRMINYQGRLVSNNVPVSNTVSLVFNLYTNSNGGSTNYTFTTNDVPVANGLYSVMIGDPTNTDLLDALTTNAPPLYLGVSVDGTELLPRTLLASVPYALKAEGLTGTGQTALTNLNNATNALNTRVNVDLAAATNALIAATNALNTRVNTDLPAATNVLNDATNALNTRVNTDLVAATNALNNATNALNTRVNTDLVAATNALNDATNALNIRVNTDLPAATNALIAATNALNTRVNTDLPAATNALIAATNALNTRVNTDLPAATNALNDATNALNTRVTAVETGKLDLVGGIMTGLLNMGGQIVSNATYYGDGVGITNLQAANITGYVAFDANPEEITVTTNTPLFAGQCLIGTVSNQVWLSKGTTTNDWIVIKAAP